MKRLLLTFCVIGSFQCTFLQGINCPDVKVSIKYRDPETKKIETEIFTDQEVFGIKCGKWSGITLGPVNIGCDAPDSINWNYIEKEWQLWWWNKDNGKQIEEWGSYPEITSIRIECGTNIKTFYNQKKK